MSHLVECPLCFQNYSTDLIQVHAQKCKGGKGDKSNASNFNDKAKSKTIPAKNEKGFLKIPRTSPWNSGPSPKRKRESEDKNLANDSFLTNSKSVFGARNKFTSGTSQSLALFTPLAERSRPSTVDDFVGQKQIFERNSVLSQLLKNNVIPSMILWGPPGCGKTSLANVIATKAKTSSDNSLRFVKLSATSSGKADVQAAVGAAKNDWRMFKRRTILFIDEIHRFNKLQQDTFLPHVEDGTVILIGATTENPSFSLNSALLSRCKVVVLEKLSQDDVKSILMRALIQHEKDVKLLELSSSENCDSSEKPTDSFTMSSSNGMSSMCKHKTSPIQNVDNESSHDEDLIEINDDDATQESKRDISITHEAIEALAGLCDGDARTALSGLQMSVQAARASTSNYPSSGYVIDLKCIKQCFQRSHLLYDRKGDQHYDIISAFQKSIRGSDDNATLYWLARMLEGGEDPRYIARRLIRTASEDIGLADSNALNLAVSAHKACEFIGKPECDVVLAQCAVYLARAPKSPEVYLAYTKVKECISNHEGPLPGVPLHLRNAPTKLMESLGYGKNYSYKPNPDQTYMPDSMLNHNFFDFDDM